MVHEGAMLYQGWRCHWSFMEADDTEWEDDMVGGQVSFSWEAKNGWTSIPWRSQDIQNSDQFSKARLQGWCHAIPKCPSII